MLTYLFVFFFFNDTATPAIYTHYPPLSLHDPLPISAGRTRKPCQPVIELSSASEDRRVLRIVLINDDMPFLVDSIAAAIAEAGLVIDLLAHPVLSVERDAKGTLAAIPDTPTAGSHRESKHGRTSCRARAGQ